MRTPKKWLQDWLGITPLAVRVAEIDIKLHPEPFPGGNIGVPTIGDASITSGETLSGYLERTNPPIEEIKKGYES